MGRCERCNDVIISRERDVLRNLESALFQSNGLDSAVEDIVVGERAIRTTSPEAAVGILTLSFVVSKDHDFYSGLRVGVHPAKEEVLYFSSETLTEQELASRSVKLMHFTDLLLKFVQSPFRVLKDDINVS